MPIALGLWQRIAARQAYRLLTLCFGAPSCRRPQWAAQAAAEPVPAGLPAGQLCAVHRRLRLRLLPPVHSDQRPQGDAVQVHGGFLLLTILLERSSGRPRHMAWRSCLRQSEVHTFTHFFVARRMLPSPARTWAYCGATAPSWRSPPWHCTPPVPACCSPARCSASGRRVRRGRRGVITPWRYTPQAPACCSQRRCSASGTRGPFSGAAVFCHHRMGSRTSRGAVRRRRHCLLA